MGRKQVAKADDNTTTIVILGEPDSGKTGLFTKFFHPSENIAAMDPNNRDYWGNQTEPTTTEMTFNGQKIRFVEVPGSRGRMSNYYEVHAAMQTANAVIQCRSLAWDADGFADDVIHSLNRAQSISASFNQDKNKKAQPEKAKLPYFAIATMKDIAPDFKLDTQKLVAAGIQSFVTSAVTGEGVQEAITEIMTQIVANKTQTVKPVVAPVATPAAPQKHSMISKLIHLFGGSKSAKATPVAEVDKAIPASPVVNEDAAAVMAPSA